MVSEAEAIRALHVCFSILLLAVLLWRWREYRIDMLRDRLFALRDGLFDYAFDAKLLKHPAHEQLRVTINSMIRFAHKVTFLRLVLAIVAYKFWPVPETLEPALKWAKATQALPEPHRTAIYRIHGRMLVLVVRHMITGSPVLLMGFVVAGACIIVQGTIRRTLQSVAELFARRLPGLDLLEAQALTGQQLL